MLKFAYLSLVQGLSEFLPISSSGHLCIFKNIFTFKGDFLPFFAFLHITTLAVVLVFFYKDIFLAFRNKKIVAYLIIITGFTALSGVLIDRFLSSYFTSNGFIFIFLFINGLILLTGTKIKGKRELADITILDAVVLGILQGFSFLPGISRSGITIIGLLARKFRPKAAFALSFIMSIFPIAGTFLFKVNALTRLKLTPFILSLSFLITFIVGFFSLYLVKRALVMKKFIYFGYYCIIISIGGLLFIK